MGPRGTKEEITRSNQNKVKIMLRGRPKGVKNKRSFNAEELAQKMNVCPLEILLMVASGDWKGLGYAEKSKITFTAQGLEIVEDNVPLKERVSAAGHAAKYLYSQKQPINEAGNTGIKIEVVDYTSKNK